MHRRDKLPTLHAERSARAELDPGSYLPPAGLYSCHCAPPSPGGTEPPEEHSQAGGPSREGPSSTPLFLSQFSVRLKMHYHLAPGNPEGSSSLAIPTLVGGKIHLKKCLSLANWILQLLSVIYPTGMARVRKMEISGTGKNGVLLALSHPADRSTSWFSCFGELFRKSYSVWTHDCSVMQQSHS